MIYNEILIIKLYHIRQGPSGAGRHRPIASPTKAARRLRTANEANSKRPDSDEKIYQAIYETIIEHRLAPGSKLIQSELCEAFGVSKSRVWPFLFRLAEQRIVNLEPIRGAFVALPSFAFAEARAIIDARLILEEGVVRLVVRGASAAQLHKLQSFVDEEREARLNYQLVRAHRLTGQCPICLAELTGKEVLVDLVALADLSQ